MQRLKINSLEFADANLRKQPGPPELNNMKNRKTQLVLLALLLNTSTVATLGAEPDAQQQSADDQSTQVQSERAAETNLVTTTPSARLPASSKLQEYDEIVSPDMESAGSLANRARVALRNGNYSRAIDLAKRSLKKDDDDPDVHAIYAESIEAKLEHQAEKDPDLYRTCLHEWLLVYRNELGEEKGMTIRGINIMGTAWNDNFRGGLAKIHLKKLTGYLPKAWETDNRYLSRVLKPAETTVTGKVKPASQ
jgi:tetratricopeptide (TPR) repeat protein